MFVNFSGNVSLTLRGAAGEIQELLRAEKSTIMQPTFSVKKKTHLTNITVSFQLIQSRYSGQVRR
jgi:hypothetical protein